MATINISLPDQLKNNAEKLISEGHYVSFSDVVRSALRKLVSESKYDRWAQEAKEEYARGEGTVVKTKKELIKYMKKFK